MRKIKRLTPKQEARLPEFAERWTAIGLSTAPADKPKAEAAIIKAYAAAGLEAPKIKIWLDSPYQGALAAALLCGAKIVGAQGEVQVRAQVRDLVGAQVEAKVEARVGARVRDQVGAQVWTQVWAQVVRAGYGSHEAGWLSFYSYFLECVNLERCEELRGLMELAESCGWFWPLTNAVIFTDRPKEIHLKKKKLHKEDGPAILYRDGFAVYALNGVRVTKELVETPRESLDAKLVLTEQNAEIRREILRKIGIERACRDLGAKTIDTMDDYELLLLDLGDDRSRPYLKMKNPSIDAIHVEGVYPDCKTVKEALSWRNGTETYEKPVILT